MSLNPLSNQGHSIHAKELTELEKYILGLNPLSNQGHSIAQYLKIKNQKEKKMS